MHKTPIVLLMISSLVALAPGTCLAQAVDGNQAGAATASSSSTEQQTATHLVSHHSQPPIRPFSTVGIGVAASTLGIGIQAATPLSQRTNLRAGFNVLSYSHTIASDNINYDGTLSLRSFDALLDWFPFHGGFHLSGGALLYNGNQVKANIAVPGGDSLTLNGTSYISDPSTPVTGNGQVKFNRAAPMVLAGFGNLVPRTKHFSVQLETGVVFSGSPQLSFTLNGDVCDQGVEGATNCRAISSDPTVMSNIQAKQTKLNSEIKSYKYYPVLQLGFAYKF